MASVSSQTTGGQTGCILYPVQFVQTANTGNNCSAKILKSLEEYANIWLTILTSETIAMFGNILQQGTNSYPFGIVFF